MAQNFFILNLYLINVGTKLLQCQYGNLCCVLWHPWQENNDTTQRWNYYHSNHNRGFIKTIMGLPIMRGTSQNTKKNLISPFARMPYANVLIFLNSSKGKCIWVANYESFIEYIASYYIRHHIFKLFLVKCELSTIGYLTKLSTKYFYNSNTQPLIRFLS